MLNNASKRRGLNPNKLEGMGENTSRMLGGLRSTNLYGGWSRSGRIWCEGEEGRRRESPLFLAFGRRRERLGMGGLGPRVVLSTFQGQTPGSLAPGPFATSAGQRAGGQCGLGARRQGSWRLVRNPDARDVSVTQRGQNRIFFETRSNKDFVSLLG